MGVLLGDGMGDVGRGDRVRTFSGVQMLDSIFRWPCFDKSTLQLMS